MYQRYRLTDEEIEADDRRFKELHASMDRCKNLLGHAKNLIDRIYGPVESEEEEEPAPLMKIA